MMSGGLDDRGTFSKVLADADNSRFYLMTKATKSFDILAGGTQTQINTGGNPLRIGASILLPASGAGIGAAQMPAKNLSGSIAISNQAATATQLFATPEDDAKYRIVVAPTSTSGTPAPGSNRVVSIAKTARGFTIFLENAPGTGNSVTFDWMISR